MVQALGEDPTFDFFNRHRSQALHTLLRALLSVSELEPVFWEPMANSICQDLDGGLSGYRDCWEVVC